MTERLHRARRRLERGFVWVEDFLADEPLLAAGLVLLIVLLVTVTP